MPATVDDTYAEAFRSIYASVLITARDRYWLDRAVNACTGNASSAILCDCEAGLERYVPASETPDGRPGAVVQFHVPRFHKDREQRLERSVLVRVSQNVMTCPTATAFNVLDASGSIGVTERTAYILRVRQLAVGIAKAYVAEQTAAAAATLPEGL